MTIEITQFCDGCGETRLLKVSSRAGKTTIAQTALSDLWVEAGKEKHICPRCIKKLLED